MNKIQIVLICAACLFFVTSTVTAQKAKNTMTNADVLEMVKAGLPESTIVLAIQQSEPNFDTSTKALIELSKQGVSQKVMDAMLQAQPTKPVPQNKQIPPMLSPRPQQNSGFVGEWSDGTSWLTIIKDGDNIRAIYLTDNAPQVMKGELLTNNQLKLKNNRLGEFFNPSDDYKGDFDNEAWIELSADSSFLTVRFNQAKGGRSLVMKRIPGNPASQVTESKPVIWASVSIGSESDACAITTTGVPYCWDGESSDTDRSPNLVEVIGGMNIGMVSKGDTSTCWVTTDGVAYCSGENDYGQLGDGIGNTTGIQHGGDKVVPTAVAGGLKFSVVSVGKDHACGLTTNKEAYCWGSNFYEQIGNSLIDAGLVSVDVYNGSLSPFPVAGGLRFTTLSAGTAHTCAVTTEGAAYCWGEGSSGQLGNGATERSAKPVAVAGGLKFASVTTSKPSLGTSFTCGLTTSGSAYCWGVGENYQLGNGQTQRSSVPVAVTGGFTFTSLSAGVEHVCGVTTSGAAYCWGENTWGELGTGNKKAALTPVPVAGNLKFASLSSSLTRTCGVTVSGEIYCWGNHGYGDGNTPTSNSSVVPVVAVRMPTDEDGFKAFFREFRSAVRKRDRTTLELMMSPKIVFPVEVRSPSMAFDYLGYNNGEGWKRLEKAATYNTVPYKDSGSRPVIRVTNDPRSIFGPGSVYFARRSDGTWQWIRFTD